MHVIISALTAAAILIWWLGRAAKNAHHITDAAQELSNLPRKLRHRKKAGKQGLALVENPVEAAAVLLIAIARMDDLGKVTDNQQSAIATVLKDRMDMSWGDADDMVIQMRSLSQYLNQAESALYPMVDLLRNKINQDEATELSSMMQEIAVTETPINLDQTQFIHSFEERMGIGA